MDGSALIDLKIEGGKTRPVIVKDQQLHPVRGEVMHIDLLEVRLDEKIQAPVAVHIEGAEEAPGIKEGGVMEQVTHQLNIEALPTDIPDYITVDVSGMEIAATMHLSEIDSARRRRLSSTIRRRRSSRRSSSPPRSRSRKRSRRRPSWSARRARRARPSAPRASREGEGAEPQEGGES